MKHFPKFHRKSDEYEEFLKEKSTIRIFDNNGGNKNPAKCSVSSTSLNKCANKSTLNEDDEDEDVEDMDMISATDSDVSFYVSCLS